MGGEKKPGTKVLNFRDEILNRNTCTTMDSFDEKKTPFSFRRRRRRRRTIVRRRRI